MHRSSMRRLTFVALPVPAMLLIAFAVSYGQNTAAKSNPDPKEQPGRQPDIKRIEGSKLRLKVFRLSHSDPEQVSSVLQSVLPQDSGSGLAGLGALGLGGGSGIIGLGGPGSGGAPPGIGIGGGAFGALGGPPGGVNGPNWRLTADPRTKSLIIRGSEKDIDLAADLVTVLDLPADKAIPKVKNLRAYKLKHANAGELNSVLSSLEMDARMVPVEKGNILIVAGSEDVMKDMDSVVEALDIEVQQSKEPPKPDKEQKSKSEKPLESKEPPKPDKEQKSKSEKPLGQ
ncbi:MAG: secretin N-terminal domain-containing protein [Gemmataceae bacterium]